MTARQGFLLVVVAVSAAFVVFVYGLRGTRAPEAVPGVASNAAAPADGPSNIPATQPRVYFRNTRLDDTYGRLVAVPIDAPGGARQASDLSCDRVDVAGGRGVCLTANRGVLTTYSAVIFDESTLKATATLPLSGIPSRVRVSPDGALAGITVFVSGHAYSQDAFSTQTILVDTATGAVRADLEMLEVSRDGRPFKKQDFNYWGVTFARDSNTFYATVSSGGSFYLVRADASTKKAEVIGEGVECPSLSPDNRRIAFKRREIVGGRLIWRLALLELETGKRSLVAGETRSVDDQVEWLDNDRILYSTPSPDRPGSMIVSVASVTDGGVSQYLADAYSPAVP